MKIKDSLDRLSHIQSEQFQALKVNDIEHLERLEGEKTTLLQQLFPLSNLAVEQRQQLETVLATQKDLEQLCAEVRDELGSQISAVMQRHKAVKAYKQIE